MFENTSLVHGATELSPALARDDKVRLWKKLTSPLYFLGPPRKEPEGWKRYWACKCRRRGRGLSGAGETGEVICVVYS
uniref:Uncharacterized protein n=1 Tax=Ixodes ricinus TaxID=34613 RepID=A0A147BAX2_IXORI